MIGISLREDTRRAVILTYLLVLAGSTICMLPVYLLSGRSAVITATPLIVLITVTLQVFLVRRLNRFVRRKVHEARELFEAGNTSDAVARLEPLVNAADVRPQLLAMLLYSANEEDWRRAAALLGSVGSPEMLSLLAFKYWTIRNMDKAVHYGEQALEMARKGGEALAIARAKNNLAYYLAEVGQHEEIARRLANEALSEIRTLRRLPIYAGNEVLEAKFLSTLGFVKIVFAKSPDEVNEAVKLCSLAVQNGASLELHEEHIERARLRLSPYA